MLTAAVMAVAIPGAMTTVKYVSNRWDGDLRVAWVAVCAIFVVFVIGRATGDASVHNHANCWRLSGSNGDEIVACAPGSEPRQGSTYNRWTDSGSERACGYLRASDAAVSVWHCRTDSV